MKITHPLAVKFGGITAAATVRGWMSTLDYKAAFYEPEVDPVDPRNQGQMIYVFWHEYILLPLYLRGYCNVSMLLSLHRDADILNEVAGRMGFGCVRGSTFSGSAAAVRELLSRGQQANLAITPDGPRGPRRRLSQGAIFLASKMGLPIVAMGLGCDRPWRFKSWDRFALPRPFSRARGVVSPAMTIPPSLDRDGVEHYRLHVEQMLNRMTLEAEAWAEAGTPKVDQVPIRRAPMRLRHRPAAERPPHQIHVHRMHVRESNTRV